MKPINRIENFFVSLFAGGSKGSGKRIVNIKRRNAITIRANTPSELYDIYKRYYLIKSIIGKSVGAISTLPIWIEDENGEDKSEQAERLRRILNKPNRYSKSSFLGDIAFNYLLYGVAFVGRKVYSIGEPEYYVIDNRRITDIVYKDNGVYGSLIKSVTITNDIVGKEITIKGDDVLVIGELSTLSGVNGENGSIILSVKDELEVYANLIDVLGESYGNGGARKIISFKNTNDDLAFNTPIQNGKEELKKELREEYGRNSGDEMYILSTQEVGVANLSSPVSEFDAYNMLISLETMICNAFNYPPVLFGIKSGAYKSQTEGEKAFYIGMLSPIADKILRSLVPFFDIKLNGVVELDYSGLDFFQSGKTQKGTAIQTLMQGATQAIEKGVLTKEEVRKELLSIL